jgi:hypothetical protein
MYYSRRLARRPSFVEAFLVVRAAEGCFAFGLSSRSVAIVQVPRFDFLIG